MKRLINNQIVEEQELDRWVSNILMQLRMQHYRIPFIGEIWSNPSKENKNKYGFGFDFIGISFVDGSSDTNTIWMVYTVPKFTLKFNYLDASYVDKYNFLNSDKTYYGEKDNMFRGVRATDKLENGQYIINNYHNYNFVVFFVDKDGGLTNLGERGFYVQSLSIAEHHYLDYLNSKEEQRNVKQ